MTVSIALTIAEREFCKAAGDARTEANKHKSDIACYDSRRFNLTGKQSNRIAAMTEGAVFKYLGGDILNHDLTQWAHYVPNDHPNYTTLVKEQSDCNIGGLEVEVRRANSLHSPIPVRPKDRKPGAIVVQGYVAYRQALKSPDNPFPPITVPLHVVLLGWAYADDDGEQPDWATDAQTLVVPRRPMDTFGGVLV